MYQLTILTGRVGKTKLAYTPQSNTPVCNYSIVTTKSIKDKDTGEYVEKEEWHQIVSFNKCAEHVGNKLKPGDVITVQGEWETRDWEDSNGNKHYMKELFVNNFPTKMPKYWTKDGNNADPQQRNPSQQPAQAVGDNYMANASNSYDDDIPL